MSIKIMTDVWAHSKAKGSALLLLLAIADHADDDGVAYPGIEILSRKIRMSTRQVSRLRKALYEMGELEYISGGKGPSDRLNVRVISAKSKVDKLSTFDANKVDTQGVKVDTQGVQGRQLCLPNRQEPSRTVNSIGVSDDDFAAAVLAESYANPVPGYIIGSGRNPEIAIDNFFDTHVAIIERYGRDTYKAAVAACVESNYADGRKAEHVENQAQQIKQTVSASKSATAPITAVGVGDGEF